MVANPIAAFFSEACELTDRAPRRRGLQRRMRPFRPAAERHLAELRRRRGVRHALLAAIYREPSTLLRGRGLPTVVLGGFVPDATEALHCQRRLLRRFGDIYYVNYPRAGFDREVLFAQLRDLLAELAARGERPVMFGVSFGCGLLGDFLAEERLREGRPAARVSGLVLVSPVLSVEDLTGEQVRDCTLVGRICLPMLRAAEAEQVEASVRNARRFFGRLFTAGGQNQRAMRRLRWRRQGAFLKERILETVQEITAEGALQRLALLRRSCPLAAGEWVRPLSMRPVLAMFAEREDAVLASSAPVRRLLAERLLECMPHGAATVVASPDPGDAVQHASLIFHALYYNPPIERFYAALLRETRPLSVRPWLSPERVLRRFGGVE